MRLIFTSIAFILFQFSFAQNYVQLGNDINGEAAGDDCGRFASINADGNTVAFGAQSNDGVNGTDSGHVRIFSYNGTTWVQKGSDIDGEAAQDLSSRVSLSADGNTVAIGAHLNNGTGNGSGHVRVFDFENNTWTQRGIDIPSETANDQSGWAVSISADGNRIAIGSRDHRSQGVGTGQARVFSWNGTAWVKLGQDINGGAGGDEFGSALRLSKDGNTFVAGAQYSDINGNGSGAVSIYEYNGTQWTLKGATIPGTQSNGNWGISVDIDEDGNTMVAGESQFMNGNGEKVGRVRAFSWNGSQWVQKGQNIDGTGEGDRNGSIVAISENGNLIAVRSLLDNNGNNTLTGKTKIYIFNGSSWVQLGNTINGQNSGDNSGFGLGFSADATTLVIGSPLNDNTAPDAGQIRVFRLDGPLGTAINAFGNLSIYPNPSNGNFTIDLGKEYTEVSVQISNILGQQISSEKYASARIIEQRITASAGIYFVNVSTAKEGSKTLRIIKQ